MKPSWKTFKGISYAFNLLNPRAQKIFILFSVLSPMFTILDLFSLGVLTLTISSVAMDTTQPKFGDLLLRLNEIFFHVDTDMEPMSLVLKLLFSTVILMLVKTLLEVIIQYSTSKFLAKQHLSVSKVLTKNFFNQDIETINKFSSQEIAFVLNHGIYYTVNSTLSAAASAMSELTLLIGMVVLLYIFYPIATIYLLVFFLLIFGVSYFGLSKRADARGSEATSGYISSLTAIQDAIRLHRELWISNRQDVFQKRIFVNVKSTAEGYSQQVFLGQLPKVVFETALLLGILIMAATALSNPSNKSLVSLMITLTVAGIRIAPSLIRLQGSVLTLQIMRPNVFRLIDFQKQFKSLPDDIIKVSTQEFTPSIKISNVTYSFSEDLDSLLKGVSIDIKPFDVVGIYGETGAGKSTFIDLLLGFREPDEGEISISGVRPKIAKIMWPNHISFLHQKVGLIDGSVAQNIALGCEESEIDYARVFSLIQELNLSDILNEDLRLSDHIGEDGLGLSGGQRQRLSIARALYLEPQILILDEATSAQDPTSESLIQSVIHRLRGRCTIVLISHNQDFLRIADRIFQVTGGRIKEHQQPH
jgi:ATP-binding cassette subfamily C protein